MGSKSSGDGEAQREGRQEGLCQLGAVFRPGAPGGAMAEHSLQPVHRGFIFISWMERKFET